MKGKKRKKLSPANLEIMKVIWDGGELSVTDVVDKLNTARKDKLRRTTVQVQMNRLEEYGWLKHRNIGRTYYYSPVEGKQKTRRDILKDITMRVFEGSRAELVRCLIEDQDVSPEEIEELRVLLEES